MPRRVPSLGPRGEGWVVAQFALVAALVAAAVSRRTAWPSGLVLPARTLGALLAVVGALVVIASLRSLGRALTPFPRPRSHAQLVETGPYRHVRHPLYLGALLALLGLSLLATSWPSLVLTAALALLWEGKSRVEEAWLETEFPSYAEYRRRTPGRLVPWLH